MKWQQVAIILVTLLISGGVVTYTDLFGALFQLSGMDYSFTGDQSCGTECESYINVTSSYWRVCFEHSKDTQNIYIPGKVVLNKTTIAEAPNTVLFKKSTRGRTLWVNMNNVNNVVTTEPEVDVDWLVPTVKRYSTNKDSIGYWRPLKDGDCWERGEINKIKLIGHKPEGLTVKWSFLMEDKIDIDPVWTGTNLYNNIVFYAPLDGVYKDYYGLGYPTVLNSVFNKSVLYEGSYFNQDGSLEYTDTGPMNTQDDVSIKAWINLAERQATNMGIAGKISSSPSYSYGMLKDSGHDIRCRWTTGAGNQNCIAPGTSEPVVGNWEMWVCVFNETSNLVMIYKNGIQVKNCSTATRTITGGNFFIGSMDTSNRFNGTIDEVYVFNVSLSKEEIGDLYYRTLNGSSFGKDLTYYMNNSGNDANTGLTPDAPLKSQGEVNNRRYVQGYNIVYNRGDEWRLTTDDYFDPQDGDNYTNTTYGVYGTGPKPVFYGSYEANGAGNWTLTGDANIYKYVGTLTTDAGNIIFNNQPGLNGRKNNTFAGLDTNLDFWYNSTGNNVKLYYDVGNPGNVFDDIEIAVEVGIFFALDKKYIKISNHSYKYSGQHGINFAESSPHYVYDCNFFYIGGAYQTGDTRYGNCYQSLRTVDRVHVKGNNASWCYDAGFSPQSPSAPGDHNITNVLYEYNIADHCIYGIEYFSSSAGSITENITFAHNTLVDSVQVFGWSHRLGQAIRASASPLLTSNFVIRDNIFDNSTNWTVGVGYNADWNGEPPLLLNNFWSRNPVTTVFYNYTKYSDLTAFRVDYPDQTIDSIEQDINFVNRNLYDYRPVNSSSACVNGSDGKTIGALPCASSSCTYPGSGDHTYFGLDHCVIPSVVDHLKNNVFVVGPGSLTGWKFIMNYTYANINNQVKVTS